MLEAGLPRLSSAAGRPLEDLPPIELAAALEDLPTKTLSAVDAGEAEYAVAAVQRAINTLTAVQTVLVEAFATRMEEQLEDDRRALGLSLSGRDGLGDSASMLAPLLHLAPAMAGPIEHARSLVRDCPAPCSWPGRGIWSPGGSARSPPRPGC